MNVSRALLPALAALCFLSVPALAADNPPPPPPGAHGGPPGGPGDMMNFLGPEAHMMLFAKLHRETAGMSEDQRHAAMDKQMAAIRAMPEAEKQKFAAGLKAEWDALPPAEKDRLKKEMDEMRAHHPRGPDGPPPG
jgi:hypothetical protein